MRMRMHECFQMQQILVKVGLGSILIKRFGASHELSGRAQVITNQRKV